METYWIETTISKDGTLSVKGLPFTEGEEVEVLVRSRKQEQSKKQDKYPLRGLPINYTKPFDSVAENDWAVLG